MYFGVAESALRASSSTKGHLMFGIGYFKGQPTDYIQRYSTGTVRGEGMGLAFYYWHFNTQIVAVPTTARDADVVFNEITSNFQEVTVQGQLTYRIREPKKAAQLLNLRIDPYRYTYVSDDLNALAQKISNVVRIETRSEVEKRTLADVLRDSRSIAREVEQRVREAAVLDPLGVELLSVFFLSARPTPEVAKALEAEYREALMRRADEAIYARRGAAVDEERKIKEKQLESDKALEQQRQTLIDLQGANALKEAENCGLALEKEAQYRARSAEMDLAVVRGIEPRMLLAIALRELGRNAGKVGNLSITTELLASLLNQTPPGHGG
jgi:regulator of protease activity HflC (stomatin/prohibitin superfamily)